MHHPAVGQPDAQGRGAWHQPDAGESAALGGGVLTSPGCGEAAPWGECAAAPPGSGKTFAQGVAENVRRRHPVMTDDVRRYHPFQGGSASTPPGCEEAGCVQDVRQVHLAAGKLAARGGIGARTGPLGRAP